MERITTIVLGENVSGMTIFNIRKFIAEEIGSDSTVKEVRKGRKMIVLSYGIVRKEKRMIRRKFPIEGIILRISDKEYCSREAAVC